MSSKLDCSYNSYELTTATEVEVKAHLTFDKAGGTWVHVLNTSSILGGERGYGAQSVASQRGERFEISLYEPDLE